MAETTRAHKEVLFYASPFFEAALSGNWAETVRRQSISSVITISRPLPVPGESTPGPTEMTFTPMDPDMDPEELDVDGELKGELSESDLSDCGVTTKEKEKARLQSLARLQKGIVQSDSTTSPAPLDLGALTGKPLVSEPERPKAQAKVKRRPKANGPDAVIILKEEKVGVFYILL